jgi:hypothetical protein
MSGMVHIGAGIDIADPRPLTLVDGVRPGRRRVDLPHVPLTHGQRFRARSRIRELRAATRFRVRRRDWQRRSSLGVVEPAVEDDACGLQLRFGLVPGSVECDPVHAARGAKLDGEPLRRGDRRYPNRTVHLDDLSTRLGDRLETRVGLTVLEDDDVPARARLSGEGERCGAHGQHREQLDAHAPP